MNKKVVEKKLSFLTNSKLLLGDSIGRYLIFIIAISTLLLPILHVYTAEDSIFHISSYTISLLGKYLCFALLALSLDLVWGYTGILSLGHGAFFGLGGYMMGMHLMREIGDRGVYGNPLLPDFMVFLNWEELPWFWYGFDSFLFSCLMVILIPGLLAFIFSALAFGSRVTGVYFSIITQALVFTLMLAFFQNDFGFGGNNGLTDFKDILGKDISSKETRAMFYICSAIMLITSYLICRFIVTSKIGNILVGIRDRETRMRFLGYNTTIFKIIIFTFSAALAGIAGALYVPQVGIINPGEFSPIKSIEIVVWVALGGRGFLYGAIIGAIVVNVLKSYLTIISPEIWIIFLGLIFILVTIYLPNGITDLKRIIKKNLYDRE
tara:strand:+ start:827 stop:1963 length:1137 start_codon:yes stop_codon:yes gene_type:complete